MPNGKTRATLEQWREHYWIALLVFLSCLVLATAGYIVYTITPVSSQQSHSSQSSAITATKMSDGEWIGLSDGRSAFDLQRADGSIKQQAATKMQQGDSNEAVALWSQAESNDAEALIYKQDQFVTTTGKPYITLVVGVTLTGGDAGAIGNGRDVLQGAYVAQKEYNDQVGTTGGKLLRLIIANSDSRGQYAAQVAQQIVQAAGQYEKSILGVMGWPLSEITLRAEAVLSAAHVPMVSPSATSDALTGISPYFFRVVPSNKSQAAAGAQYIERLNDRKVVLFEDPNDPYSSSLAKDFSAQFLNDSSQDQIVATEEYTVGDGKSVSAQVADAMAKQPDIIYFAGYSSDLAALLKQEPGVQVMGGDALYELRGYTSDALAGYSHLQFTAFAYPDEWKIQGQTPPAFFALYNQEFDPTGQHQNTYGFQRQTADVMLAYDAMKALLQGYANSLSTGPVSPQALQQGLTRITGDLGVQGVTGQISFSSDGDPINKTVLVLQVVNSHIRVVDTNGKNEIHGCFLLSQHCNTQG